MTNEMTQDAHLSRLQKDLVLELASLRCVHEVMVNAEGVSALPVHARLAVEAIIRRMEGYTAGELQA